MDQDLAQRIDSSAAAVKIAGAREVYVFGLAGSERLHPDSDIDMAVVGLPPEEYFRMMIHRLGASSAAPST